jgi:hypothetical protein
MGVFHLLGLVFVNAALLGTVEFITSGVVSIWYFLINIENLKVFLIR